jgi:aspartyl-tRNA synthetase
MSDVFATHFRTTAAGSLRPANEGERVRLAGWVHRRRDLGGQVFNDLRDRAGLVQVSFDPAWTPPETMALAAELGPEDVVLVEGPVAHRISVNHDLPTGEVEVRGERVERLQKADPLPIPVYRTPDEELPGEELRLRYRYLDLRRPDLQRNFVLRNRAAQTVRRYLDGQGFLEVETPILTRRTPEGARDYLVPSRVHPGEFYALPQSPQLYKQLLMVSGFDRYYQIVKCLRDEDLRADRQPEFTQIDAEMSFVTEEDVFRIGEEMMAVLWRELLGVELPLPFPRLTYAEAMLRFGTDKPDLRYGLEIVDVTEVLQGADFRIFQATQGTTQQIRGIRVPGGAALSRKELDELQVVAKRGRAAGALWVKRGEDGFSGQFAKALDGAVAERFLAATGMEPGDLFVAVVGEFRIGRVEVDQAADLTAGRDVPAGNEAALDELRRHLAARLGLVDPSRHAWLWVTEFPLFDWDADQGRLVSAHHPFTMPHAADLDALAAATGADAPLDTNAMRALYLKGLRSLAYDAVYNGNELASGSVRIHDPALQQRVFRALGLGEAEARAKFGFLLEAFRYGAPPHAGFAFGFDRMVMLIAGAASLRDVIAFPKTTSARSLMEGAPAPLAASELGELHIQVKDQEARNG